MIVKNIKKYFECCHQHSSEGETHSSNPQLITHLSIYCISMIK